MSFLWNLGKSTDLVEVSFVKSPVVCVLPSVSVVEHWNSLSFDTAVTVNVPLNPELPIPVALAELTTLTILTLSLTFKLCGNSALTVTVLPDAEQVLINLGFLWKNTSSASIVFIEKSVLSLAPVVLDSWMTKPSLGSFAFADSFGTTTRTVYNLSSSDLGSTVLDIKDTPVFSPKAATPWVFKSV